jgi:hypothetical protein
VAAALTPFRELHFGHLDASQEAADDPELLRSGFYDYRDAAYGIASMQNWLLLGPKGAGKTAVLEHLRLEWSDRPDRFFQIWNLGGFPVNDVTQIRTGQTAGASRAQSAWEFLLLLRVIESLDSDNGLSAPASFGAMVKSLQSSGHLIGDWTSKVVRWSGSQVKFDAKLFGADAKFDAATITPLEVSAYLRDQIGRVSTNSTHIIALDGLDSFFFEAEDEWRSLAGLMSALHVLNREFRSNGLRVALVAAVRSDVFDVLPGAELNKLKPHAVHLDWHARGIGAENNLWILLTRKAAASTSGVSNLVRQYLSRPVSIGPHTSMPEFLLDNTRLLPRDAVAMMHYLQRTYAGGNPIPESSAKVAVAHYCEQYFVGEIFDNLAGVLPPGSARKLASFKDALRTAPTRRFDFKFVCDELAGELDPPEIKQLLRQMFEVGGIGIVNRGYTDFTFRKVSGAGFTTRDKFILHDALVRAWNIPWTDHGLSY